MKTQYTNEFAQMALGKIEAEMVIKNGQVVNVFTNEILKADVAVSQGIIIGIGEYNGKKEIDASGKIICPGFIDSHLHLESTLVKPEELIHRAAGKGTTTFIVDPHEAANVAGVKGIQYILDQTEQVQANVFVMVPSCVPSMEIEDNGAVISAADMAQFLDNPRVLGLGEVMDCQAVMKGSQNMLDKLRLFDGKIIDGHAGYLSHEQLMCYKLAGIDTDHECCDFETAMEEARAGIHVLIREGTAAKNLEAIVTGIVANKVPVESFSFCTDDKHIAEIEQDGHIGYNVRKSISLGIDPVDAIKMATINAARTYGLKNLGALAPGYQADIVVLSDLQCTHVEQVFYKGNQVTQKGRPSTVAVDPALLHTVKFKDIELTDFQMPGSDGLVPVIEIIEGEILTKKCMKTLPVNNGYIQADHIYNKAAVVERHHETGKMGIGIVKGYGIKNGAVASTFCHDSHNLIIVGDNDEDMLLAAGELKRCGGGYTIVEQGKVICTLELPVMGLITARDHETVSRQLNEMIRKVHDMGVPGGIDPFITLSFLALPVIPEIRITARGVYDVLGGMYMALENKLGITDSSELAREEEKLSKQKAVALFESNKLAEFEVGSFAGLARIHESLFGDIYDFAGKMRVVNIAKGNFRFAPVMYLEASLKHIDNMPQSTFDEIIEKYVEMNIAHPFMDGNGRSTRIWLDMILKAELKMVIDWSKVDKADYLPAMERSPIKDVEIKVLLKNALTNKINDREMYMKGIDASYFYEGYNIYKTEEVRQRDE